MARPFHNLDLVWQDTAARLPWPPCCCQTAVVMKLEAIQSAILTHGPGPMQVLVVGENFAIPMYAGCAVYCESEGAFPLLNFNVWKHDGRQLEPVPERLRALQTVATKDTNELAAELARVARDSTPEELEGNLSLVLHGWAL